MNKLTSLLLASACMAGAVVPLASTAAPVTYELDKHHTFPRFSYNHLGFSTQISRFDTTTGKVVYDKEAQTGSVDLTIDMTSVNTGSKEFDQHIQEADFFDTAKFPRAHFKSTDIVFENGEPVRINGDLTIKGITKPISLTVTSFANKLHPMEKRDALGAAAMGVIKRSDFKADKYVPMVPDEITLIISMEALAEK